MAEPTVRFAAVDATSAVAPFEQIRAGAAARISAGDWPVGARLPTVRALAAELGVAANTVARAYRELESAGLVETRGRAGTVVAARTDVDRRARDAATGYVRTVRSLGVAPADAVALVRAALDAGPE